LGRMRGDLLPGVRWAGRLRRWVRTTRTALLEVDLAVKIATPVLFVTLLASTLVFRYGLGTGWGEGLYETASLVAHGSSRHGERVVAIDRVADNPFLATARRKGVPTFVGDATVPEVLKQTRAETAKAVVACTSDELANLEIALLVREANPAARVVVRLNDPGF